MVTGFSDDYPRSFVAYIMRNGKYLELTLMNRDLKSSWPLSERVHMGLGYKYTPGTDLTHMSL